MGSGFWSAQRGWGQVPCGLRSSSNSDLIEVRSQESFDPAKEDTGWNLAAAKGIENAVRDFRAADRPYNIAVLPAEHGSIYVYLYPAQVKEGVYPIGADARYRVSPDGTKIIEKRRMHKAVIESVPSSAPGKVAGGYHTHILSEVPEGLVWASSTERSCWPA